MQISSAKSKESRKWRERFFYCLQTRTLSQLLLLLVLAGVLVILGDRLLSYRANTKVWFKLPTNFQRRHCPAPGYETIGSARPNICMTTLTDEKAADLTQRLVRARYFGNLLELTWPNKMNYCQKHGYQLFDESQSLDTTRPPSWSKIRAVQRLLTEEKCDWVFWLDADTVIMNSTIRIEEFLPASQYDLVFTQQKGQSWNAGAWFARNTPYTHQFLDHWWKMESFVRSKGLTVSGDNDALKHFLTNMDPAEFDAHIAVPARCHFNSVSKFMTKEQSRHPERISYADLPDTERYFQGDLVAHVAGVDNKITTTMQLLEDAI